MIFSVIKKFLEKQEAIFNMCIDQLPLEMKEHYEELVIFREDVNITPQVIELLILLHLIIVYKTFKIVYIVVYICFIDIGNFVGRISFSS